MVIAEQQLVARMRAGDEAAFRSFVRQHHAGLVRLAQGFCRIRSFSDLAPQEAERTGPMVDPERFNSGGGSAEPPVPWDSISPEREVAGREVVEHIREMLRSGAPISFPAQTPSASHPHGFRGVAG